MNKIDKTLKEYLRSKNVEDGMFIMSYTYKDTTYATTQKLGKLTKKQITKLFSLWSENV